MGQPKRRMSCSLKPTIVTGPAWADGAGRWAMTVTKTWRLTFIRIDETTIADLDLEDYH